MNASSEISPLKYPAVWPPPLEPPTPCRFFHRIPIVGWLALYVTWLRHNRKHQRTVLDPIADEIVRQLNLRPTSGGWPVDAEQRKIVKIISEAVCLEKGTGLAPALHPEDSCQLFFWGTFDDITPLIISVELSKQFGFDLPREILIRSWDEN